MTPPKLSKPRAILFDWDNTLVDTWPLIHQALNRTLRYMEHPEWSAEKVRSEVKQSMRDSFPAMFGDRWKEAADYYQTSYRAIHLEHLTPIPGAAEMLAAIAPQVFVAVVSNKQGPTLRKEVEKLGWGKFFGACVGASDAARDKPHPDPALLALQSSTVEPGAHVWFVGDTNADLGCAEAIGATAILYGDTESVPLAFDAQVHDQAQLAQLIQAHS